MPRVRLVGLVMAKLSFVHSTKSNLSVGADPAAQLTSSFRTAETGLDRSEVGGRLPVLECLAGKPA